MSRSSEVSAGLLAFRRRPQLQFLLAHPGGPFWTRRDEGAWTIPKGRVENNADLLATAMREFTEETSFTPRGDLIALSPVRQKSGKTVHAWAFEADYDLKRFCSNMFELEWPPRSGRRQSYPELDRIGWFPYTAAMKKIIGFQQPFLRELMALLQPKATTSGTSSKPATLP